VVRPPPWPTGGRAARPVPWGTGTTGADPPRPRAPGPLPVFRAWADVRRDAGTPRPHGHGGAQPARRAARDGLAVGPGRQGPGLPDGLADPRRSAVTHRAQDARPSSLEPPHAPGLPSAAGRRRTSDQAGTATAPEALRLSDGWLIVPSAGGRAAYATARHHDTAARCAARHDRSQVPCPSRPVTWSPP
jgi:hypothetical protein